MKRTKILGLCLVAAFAISIAVTATSAMALPEYGICVLKEKTGKYADTNCVKKATTGEKTIVTKYEFKKEIPGGLSPEKGLTAKGGHSSLETEEGSKIECTSSATKGEILVKIVSGKQAPSKEVTNVVAKFFGCTEVGKNCQNTGAPLGEITTNPLKGPLGYISGKVVGGGGSPVIGQELTPVAAKKLFVTFECEGVGKVEVGLKKSGTLGDCIIAPFSTGSINVMSKNSELLYNGTKSGSGQEQLPQAFEGKTTHCNLETKLGEGPWERSLQVGNVEQETESTIEIKA